ncbi:MAG: Ig-like domain-containing protein, partial [Chryseosolibacter sp.]
IAAPVEGVVDPGRQQRINVSFDASALLAGTYQKEIVIENNDPEKPTLTVAITLQVSNNNAPIASVSPADINFKSVQVGTRSTRIATISNAGSDPLIISAVTSDNPRFTVSATQPVTLQAFAKADFRIVYSPSAIRATTGKVTFTTNDPANSTLNVGVRGEGIAEPPIVVLPNTFQETLDQGTKVNRTLMLTNNGSQDVTYRIDMANIKPVSTFHDLPANKTDSAKVILSARRERLEAIYAAKTPEQQKLLKVIDTPQSGSKHGQSTSAESLAERTYITGFEEFTVGPLGEQNGWYTSSGFFISSANPDQGAQHLQGMVDFSGDVFSMSPDLYSDDFYALQSYMSVRLNIPQSGSSWYVIPIGSGFTSAEIRFNADRTIDALVGENDYNTRWERVPFTTPEGYFALSIAVKGAFSDTTYLPYYSAFIDNQHIFSGVGVSGSITQVAFYSGSQSPEAVMDIDALEFGAGEFVPDFIKPGADSGIIPAGQSVNVNLRFDAGGIDFGFFEADLLIHIDENDSLTVPVTLAVTGPGAIVIHPDMLWIAAHKHEAASTEMTISNTGGRPVKYHFESGLPDLSVIPASGTLGIRETQIFTVKFDGRPGIYTDELRVHTDFSSEPLKRVVDVNIRDSATLFYAPETLHIKIPQGQISTRTFQIRNDGLNTVSFQAWVGGELSVDPATGSVGQEPLTMTLTLDGRGITVDHFNQSVGFRTNDSMKEYHYISLEISVIPDTTHYGKISQEIWTGLPGSEISAIPVNTPPSRTNMLHLFEAPANQGDRFGSRIRGYVIPFASGEHTFRIASNDNSELWLSTDDSPAHKKKIASVTGYTNPRQWDKYPSQKSEPIHLTENKRYYIEALHKETVGADHIAVGWQPPIGEPEAPIPGVRLVRYEESINQTAHVAFVKPQEGEVFSANSVITLQADAHDEDGNIVKVEFFNGSEMIGLDITTPYTFTWKNVPSGNYTLVAKAFDNYGGTDSATVNIVVTQAPSCAEAGHIAREQWNNVPGTLISSIPLQKTPSLTQTLTAFEARRNLGDNYGTRIRGFLCVPQSGPYTFWIASNDKSELWLSRDESPANKVRIAYVSGYTDYRQWSKYSSQKSSLIVLEAGRKYYIEALHKESVGTDHLAVGWQLPDRTMERPIPGMRLVPFNISGNQLPVVMITRPQEGDTFAAPATIQVSADASDGDGRITRVEFFNGTRKLGEDLSVPYSINWRNVAAGDYSLTAVATDNTTGSATSTPVQISVAAMCIPSGTITREYWTGVSGNLVSSIPVKGTPDGSELLTLFEGPDAGINYGARISGYICPPATGDYYFWIASNDHSELWLSTDDNEQNKVRIAFVTGATNPREWTKFTTQRSAVIRLTQGMSYYIEALHKQGVGADHVAVGWQLPDGKLERPIGGNRLSPATSAAAGRLSLYRTSADSVTTQGMDVQCYPNPVDGKTLIVATQTSGIESAPRQIEILRLTGASVYKQTDLCAGDCTTEINVREHLTPGVYILQVRMGRRVVTEKLVVR